MTGDVKGLEFYVSSQKALPEIERFEAGIDRVTKALDDSAKSIETFDERLDRLSKSRGGDGLGETARNTKQVSAAVQELLAIKKREIEVDQKRAELQAKTAKARAEAIAKAREQAQAERRDTALRQLAQEEQAVRLARTERERYRLTIEAEAVARRAGLAIGSAEYQDFVRRTVAVRELAAAQELAEKRQNTFGAGLGRLGITAGGALRTLTQLTAGFGAIYAARSAVNTIAETEDRLRILQSVSGATAEELDRLSAAANTLSLNSRFSFSDGTQALINLAKAGATASEAVEALPGVSNLARAGLLSLDDAVDTVVQTMSQFGLAIEDSTRIGDVLVKAADATTSSVSSLADSLRKVGPVGREFGLSLETVTASIAQMQQAGVQARVAGTGLAAIFKQLADPVNGPEGAADALARLNLSFDDIHPRNFTAALERLAGAGLTLQDATALVGTEFDYLLTTLVRNRGEVEKLEGALNSAAGDAAAKAAATVGTLGDAFADLSNSWEGLSRSFGQGSIAASLKGVTRAGADALKVLSGDAEAMEKAGTAGYVLANGAKVAGVALASVITFNTLARIGSFSQAMYGAGKAVGTLSAAVRANPLAALASAAAAAGAAMLLFGDRVDSTAVRLEKFGEEASAAEAVAQRFDRLRRSIELAGSGGASSISDLTDALREQLILLDKTKDLGRRFVPAESVLGALEQAAPDTIAQLRNVTDEIARFGKAGKEAPKELNDAFDRLNSDVFQKFGVLLQRVQGTITRDFFGSVTTPTIGFITDTQSGIKATADEFDRLKGSVGAAATALKDAAGARKALQDGGDGGPKGRDAAAPERARTDALREFLKEKLREAQIDGQSEDQQRRAKLLQDATNAAIASGKKLRFEDLVALEAISRLQDKNAAKKTDENRSKAIQKVLDGLRNENELLQAQGAARDVLQKRQEVLAALQAAKVESSSEEYQKALDLLDVYEQLAIAEEKRTQAGRRVRLNYQDETIRRLEEEEKATRLAGAERETYVRTIEAENQARQAGLAVGSDEFNDYVKRRIAIDKLTEAQQRLADIGAQAGEAIGSSLERVIFDSENARDAIRSLAEDLGRLAFRQTVTQGLSQLLSLAGTSLANYFAGSGAPPAVNQQGLVGGFNSGTAPRLAGGTIPALSGTVVDEFSFLRRGGKNYTLAEGGKTTPEGVFRLAKDSKGNLGVTAVGGAGGDTYNMSFPSVRTAQDARAVRVTASQRVRAAKAADRSGRVGLRSAQ